ncbi:aminoethylphosphonate catabolism LysR family transcriptional regulator [Inquilinus ginsengisoli]|uniref:LysR substrate-binding domain-containing protein n=1 Tax=Inquilinus ginsengisoli TaxID=363840 RepID=UPI003D1D728B
MNLMQLRAFHAVATQASFTLAARTLGLTQPTLSQSVKALEERYGVLLFERSSRRVQPTEMGRRLFQLTTRLFDTEQEAAMLLEGSAQLARGLLQLGADSPYYVMPLIAEFDRRHPQVEIRLSIGNAGAVLEDLSEARLDVALLSNPPVDPRFHIVPLYRDPVRLMLPEGHPLAMGDAVPVAALAGQRLVMRENGSMTRRTVERGLAEAEIAPGAVFEVTGREAVQEAVALGLGLGFISAGEIRPDPRIAVRSLGDCAWHTDEYVLCQRDRRRFPAIRAFVELAAAA